MDFQSKVVYIELDEQSLHAFKADGAVVQRVALKDEDFSFAEAPPNPLQFRVTKVSQGNISPYEDHAIFTLTSATDQTVLFVNPSDRTLGLQGEQYPVPDECRFVFKPAFGPFSTEFPCAFGPFDGAYITDMVDKQIRYNISIRTRQWSHPQPQSVFDTFKEQQRLIAALGTAGAQTNEAPELFPPSVSKQLHTPLPWTIGLPLKETPDTVSYLDNGLQAGWAETLKHNGDLNSAKDTLSRSYTSDNLPTTHSSKEVVAVAKLFTVLDSLVYLRDIQYCKDLQSAAEPVCQDIAKVWSLESDGTLNTIAAAFARNVQQNDDSAVKKITEVAEILELKYKPLCSLSQPDLIAQSGPYCGAFYSDSYDNGKDPFIVLAFKGTGSNVEIRKDCMCGLMATTDLSPLEGKVHMGFLHGIFGNMPIGVRDGPKGPYLEKGLPYQMIQLQLWKLQKEILALKPANWSGKIQIWNTGHSLGGAYATVFWAALLAAPPPADSSIRDLVTFGSPRVGDSAFADSVRRRKGNRKSWRFVHGMDIVTNIPNRAWLISSEFIHIDTLIRVAPNFISRGGTEHKPPKSWIETFSEVDIDVLYWWITESVPNTFVKFYERVKGMPVWVSDHYLENYWAAISKGSNFIEGDTW